ncbi:uncharacterized protein PpBr36_10971, partial [Pyricularia pennisetigena]|uniref:uncharacterized protein n=1 Tax=Pyricularia pennisetigena TaxID=1578925 RepID=UPI00114DFA3B
WRQLKIVSVITFGAARIDPSSFEKWVDGLELLVSTREWKNTGFEVHLCRPSDMYLGPDAFVYHVQAWRSRSQRRAGCCRL